MVLDPNYEALANVLFEYAGARATDLASKNLKLAHYTSSENALNIIIGETMWLRNAAVMNDHSEIEYGKGIIGAAINLPSVGGQLSQVLNRAHAGLADRIISHLHNQKKQVRDRIFMASLCETEENDRLGRLSMWRAYGGNTSGAAIVFNGEVFDGAQNHLMAFASPVLYGDIEDFMPLLEAVITSLRTNPHLLGAVSADVAFGAVSSVLNFATLSIKHPGFEEEREWRIIHQPFEYSSAHVVEKVKSVTGTPQLIYEMPLVNRPGLNMPDLTLDRLLHRVIIGPSLYPETTWRAIVEALRSKGVRSPETRVVVSDIPLRQTG